MEKQGVIVKVTKWCSGMVVVTKKGGRVRICVDLTNVSGERHSLLAMEQTFVHLASRFKSLILTPVVADTHLSKVPLTHYLHHSFFCRLPFGITSPLKGGFRRYWLIWIESSVWWTIPSSMTNNSTKCTGQWSYWQVPVLLQTATFLYRKDLKPIPASL